MDYLEVSKKLDKISIENNAFFEILTEQIANEVVQFCQENDIEPNMEEFITILNHAGLELVNGIMMSWEMAKLKAIMKLNPPSDNLL